MSFKTPKKTLVSFGCNNQIRIALLVVVLLYWPIVYADSVPVDNLKGDSPAGYGNLSAIGEGTTDLTNQLIIDATPKDPLFHTQRFNQTVAPWFAWKKDLFKRRGFQFTLAYSALEHYASAIRPGKDNSTIGVVFDFGGTWALFDRNTDWQSMLEFRIADQHRLGTTIAPASFGDEIGSAWGTSLAFDDISLNAVEGWWEQRFGRVLEIRTGILDASGIFDPAALGNPFENFMGHPFNVNSAIPFPAEGLGITGHLALGDNFSIVAGAIDANGNGLDWNFDSFFNKHEHLKLVELLWTAKTFVGTGDYKITLWESGQREYAQVPAGRGYTVHGENRFGDVMPFVRYGHSEGGAAALKNMLAVGVGFYQPFGRFSDGIAIGVTWGEPFGENVRNQFGIEIYYRIQLTNQIAITTDLQYIIDPARNPQVDSL